MDERYGGYDGQEAVEQRRLRLLGEVRDPHTVAHLARLGLRAGDAVLEVGAGAGTMTAHLADVVGPSGYVLATDVDVQFHSPVASPVELIVHDIVRDPLPRGDFDLVHARAVLQHVPERDDVVATLLGAARPGGALLLEEGDFRGFVDQPLPEPYGTVHRLMNDPAFTPWREPSFGTRLPALLRDLGAVDIDVHGDAWAMRPGTAAGDWWFLAVAETLPKLVDAGLLDAAGADAVRATITDPDLVIVSPVSLAISARRATP